MSFTEYRSRLDLGSSLKTLCIKVKSGQLCHVWVVSSICRESGNTNLEVGLKTVLDRISVFVTPRKVYDGIREKSVTWDVTIDRLENRSSKVFDFLQVIEV